MNLKLAYNGAVFAMQYVGDLTGVQMAANALRAALAEPHRIPRAIEVLNSATASRGLVLTQVLSLAFGGTLPEVGHA